MQAERHAHRVSLVSLHVSEAAPCTLPPLVFPLV